MKPRDYTRLSPDISEKLGNWETEKLKPRRMAASWFSFRFLIFSISILVTIPANLWLDGFGLDSPPLTLALRRTCLHENDNIATSWKRVLRRHEFSVHRSSIIVQRCHPRPDRGEARRLPFEARCWAPRWCRRRREVRRLGTDESDRC